MKTFRKIPLLILAQLAFLMSVSAQADIQNFYKIKSNGRKPTKAISYAKIPKNLPLPKLDLGEEFAIEAESKVSLWNDQNLKKLKIPEIQKLNLTEEPPLNYTVLKSPIPVLNKAQTVTVENKIKPVGEKDFLNYEPQPKKLESHYKTLIALKPSELKMLEGLLLVHREQKYPLALGVFSELFNDPDFKTDAQYYYAQAALNLNLYHTYRAQMNALLESMQEPWKLKALLNFAENIQTDDGESALKIQKVAEDNNKDLQSYVHYQMALIESLSERGEFKEALSVSEEFLKKVDINLIKKNPAIAQISILRGLIFYKLAQIDEAEKTLKDILTQIEKTEELSNPRSIASMTLARIYFQKGLYKEAYGTYLGVDKNHPLWLQSLLEQGWSQILMKDFEGSAGNMFSLHNDFFKFAFIPDSYIIRSMSYLNLCQYGDGLQILKDMNKKYRPIKTQLETFNGADFGAIKYYDTVKKALKFPQLNEINGLPKSFVLEMAHHPTYLTQQDHINKGEDEITRWNEVPSLLAKEESEILKKQLDLQGQLQKNKAQIHQIKSQDKFNEARVKLNEDRIDLEKWIFLNQQKINLIKNAQIALKPHKDSSLELMTKIKEDLKIEADNSLKKQFKTLTQNFNNLLDQTDVLAYEIFSGAGEHIRFQAATAGSEIPPEAADKSSTKNEASQLKPTQSLSWNFKGEIWEDEIGHYRSSLKNICPQEEAQDPVEESKLHQQTSNF